MKLITKINLAVVIFVALVFLAIFGALALWGGEVHNLGVILLVSGVLLVISLVLFLDTLLQEKVFGPVAIYTRFVNKVSEGDLNQKIDEISSGDVGQLGAAFNTMLEKLREIDAIKSAFNSVAAHQLRTPLSGMKWVIKYMLDGEAGALTQEQHDMLKRGYETNEKMIQLVNNLLYVSRIENGKFGYEFKEQSFGDLMRVLRENSESAVKARNIQFSLTSDTPASLSFVFDANNLLIALQNLVDNAIKYTPEGGKVSVAVDMQDKRVRIRVSDNGIGVPIQEIDQLFSKFFRASNAVRLETEGTGLGLFITKNIILRHGGTITVESKEREGTTFTVLIPIDGVVSMEA